MTTRTQSRTRNQLNPFGCAINTLTINITTVNGCLLIKRCCWNGNGNYSSVQCLHGQHTLKSTLASKHKLKGDDTALLQLFFCITHESCRFSNVRFICSVYIAQPYCCLIFNVLSLCRGSLKMKIKSLSRFQYIQSICLLLFFLNLRLLSNLLYQTVITFDIHYKNRTRTILLFNKYVKYNYEWIFQLFMTINVS